MLHKLVELQKDNDRLFKTLKEIEEYGLAEINAAVVLRSELANARSQRDEAIRISKELLEIVRAQGNAAPEARSALNTVKEQVKKQKIGL